MRRLAFLLVFLLTPAFSQDAGSALSTVVSTRTIRNTAKLTPDQAAEADRLIAAGDKARTEHEYSAAIKNYHHANAVIRNQPWTPAIQFSSGLTLKPNHSILQPGQQAELILGQIYPPDQPPAGKVTATVAFRPGFETLCKTEITPGPGAIPFTVPDVADGTFHIAVTFGDLGSKTVTVRVARNLMDQVKAAETAAAKVDPKASELPSAQGDLARIEAADAGQYGDRIATMNPAADLRDATTLLAGLEQGRDPFAGRHGDLHKAYRSAVDNSLQPYRLFVPDSYDGSKPFPLILLLHGMGGDENSMFDSYGSGAFKKLAEQHGYLVACPKGREPAAMYLGSAERDVLDVLADVRRAYKVDPNRIYMAGHSMGAYGTWSIAMDHPELFAALGPISGGGDISKAAVIAKIPQIVIHGDTDPTVPVEQSRRMVAAEKKAGAEVKYLEIPGGNHTSVAVPAFEPIFEWFDTHQRYH